MASPTRQAPSVKRLMREAKTLLKLYTPDGDIHASPLGDGDNLFDWHFTIRGPRDTPFENGLYHGRLLFPPDYPMKPPEIFLLTTSGRFETNTKICLSISGYHPETWLPSWSVNTALIALQAFFITDAKGAIGGINWPAEARQCAAMRTHNYSCKNCGKISDILDVKVRDSNTKKTGPVDENNNTTVTENKTTVEGTPTEPAATTSSDPNAGASDTKNNTEAKPPKDGQEVIKNKGTDNEPLKKDTLEEKINQEAAREERRREIELEMLRSRQDFQRNDIISLAFTVLTIAVVVFLIYRRYNNNMHPITYTEEL